MMAKPTYFIISRLIFDSAIWKHDPHILKLFIYLIGHARHSAEPKRYPGFSINRGELVTSLSGIADNNEYMDHGVLRKWSRQKVARMLDSLIDDGYISKLSDTYGTHISICNYDTYQDPSIYKSDSSVTATVRQRDSSGHGVDTNNKDNNGNNVNNGIYRKVQHLTLSVDDFNKLRLLYSQSQIDDILDQMENWAKLKTKKSAYLTAKNWLSRNTPVSIDRPLRSHPE